MLLFPWILVFHLIGLVLWLGSLLVVTRVVAVHTEEHSPEARQALGRLEMKLLKGLAHPGVALMVITGIVMISTNPGYYVHATWLHLKLLLVLVLIALDLRVTFRAKAFQAGRVEMRRGECMALQGAIALVFFLILIVVVLKPFEKRIVGSRSGGRSGPALANLSLRPMVGGLANSYAIGKPAGPGGIE